MVQKTGYLATLLILVITPLLWSLPTAMMVSELATAIPEEGGFYIWVRRGMGRFWGFQETWLTLAGSVFEMALYPNLCVAYFVAVLARAAVRPSRTDLWVCDDRALHGVEHSWRQSGWRGFGLAEHRAARAVRRADCFRFGDGTAAAWASPVPLRHVDLLGGVLIAMWNYMGWDNLSTIAGEVEAPKRTYSRAMFGAVVLVVVTYVLPVAAVAHTGINPDSWTDGGWVDIGRLIGGETLAIAIAIAGVIGAVGSFSTLMLSFSRLPLVMAEDGYLPRVFARAEFPHRRALGGDCSMRDIVGSVLSARIREEPGSGCVADRPEYPAGILGAGGAADSRAGTGAPVSRPRRPARSDCAGSAAYLR